MNYIDNLKEIIINCELEYNQAKQVYIDKQHV